MINLLVVAVLFGTLLTTFVFWQRNQNIVFIALISCIAFFTLASVYKDYDQEWRHYQNEYYDMLSRKESDPVKIAAIKNTPVKIKQVWTDALGVADRCMSCHLGVNNPDMAGAMQPFTYHEKAREHDFEDIGCVICHQGQGLGTTTKAAHADHEKHWETPILSLNLVQSACNKCHVKQVEISGGDIISRGKEVFARRGCAGCHKMEGSEKQYNIASSLRKAANKMKPSWLVQWLKDPQKMQPYTRMPNFRLSEDEAVSIVAFLMDQSDKNYSEPVQYSGGDVETGRKLFRTVGCMGCHAVGEEGSKFASNLDSIGRKVTPNWIINWILNPKGYDSATRMPNFRLSVQQAKDITAYLTTLAPSVEVPEIGERISSVEMIQHGRKLVVAKGCAGCHGINGVKPAQIGPELTKVGAKDSHHLDFGNSHDIEHTWEAWLRHKLADPTVYDTDTIKSTMPTFAFADDEVTALLVFLKGMDGSSVPVEYMRNLSTTEYEVEQGKKVISKYNCRGCHVIGTRGGDIEKFYRGKFNAPPPLEAGPLHVGERLHDSYLYSFLRKPTIVRKWLKVVMPTFAFSKDEIYYLSSYFINFNKKKEKVEEKSELVTDELLKQGRMLVLAFDCVDCHDGSRGPTFDIVSGRVQGDWIDKWLKDTRSIFPGNKMPNHWKKKNGKYIVASKYGLAAPMLGGDGEKQIHAIVRYIENYNEKPFLDMKLEEEDYDEDE